ncbi:MAG: hypothetical protein RSE13_21135 [Planktothrix sp. GU0601_MAG3]|nr:MAG: hypothetical protein RSE13_21135 [Planktothrix sp. GU0601_MAG3]
MSESALPDYTSQLQELMQRAGVSSLEETQSKCWSFPVTDYSTATGTCAANPCGYFAKN